MLIKCYYKLKKKHHIIFTGSELILFTNKNLKKNKTIH